jgi:hypothetical protein
MPPAAKQRELEKYLEARLRLPSVSIVNVSNSMIHTPKAHPANDKHHR